MQLWQKYSDDPIEIKIQKDKQFQKIYNEFCINSIETGKLIIDNKLSPLNIN